MKRSIVSRLSHLELVGRVFKVLIFKIFQFDEFFDLFGDAAKFVDLHLVENHRLLQTGNGRLEQLFPVGDVRGRLLRGPQ